MILDVPKRGGSSPSEDPASAGGILRRSRQIVRRHPRLILFPLMTLVSRSLLDYLMNGFHPPYGVAALERWNRFYSFRDNPRLLTIVGYDLAVMYCATVFNIALFHELMRVYAGERPSLIRGLRFAWSRSTSVLSWSFCASSLWMITNLVSERFSVPSGLVIGSVETLLWVLAAVFAIPVLVREATIDPITVLRHSLATVRRTWRALFYGFVQLDLKWGFLFVLSMVALGIITKGVGTISGVHELPGETIFLSTIAFGVWIGTVQNIYLCALYIYTTEGVAPDPDHLGDMDAAWKITNV